MRTRALLVHPVALALLLAATAASATPTARDAPTPDELRDQLTGLGQQVVPKRAPTRAQVLGDEALPMNPWLSHMTADELADVDWAFWRRLAEERSAASTSRAAATRSALDEIVVAEEEPSDTSGVNDTIATAQVVEGVGTGDGDTDQVAISGTFAPPPAPATAPPSSEDDGAIALANDVPLEAGGAVVTSGTIGDGPHGDSTGDFDHFDLGELDAGQTVQLDVDTMPTSGLDPTVTVFDADGNAVAFNDDAEGGTDSLLGFEATTDGTYTAAVAGFGSMQLDPFDSASGDGAGSTGDYELRIGVGTTDVDTFAVDLEAGDVLSTRVEGAATRVEVFAPDGSLVVGSSQDASLNYPEDTQLLRGGNAVADHVASTTGRYAVQVTGGDGDHETTVRIRRPGFDQRDATPTVFLDFDGATLDTSIFGAAPGDRTLSPFVDFLEAWGLSADDEDAVIDAVVAQVEEDLDEELERSGLPGDLAIELTNSRDDADTFGEPNVNRVIIGGTGEEAGLARTLGIAESIDPGNYASEETALALLDIVSAPADDDDPFTLNTYLDEDSDTIAFVGQALGNLVSHEVGHYIGNWHVDQFNDQPNIMDQGGNPSVFFGVGSDATGGTADDVDVDFGEDVFNPLEGFTGTEDTLTRSFWGLVR